MPLSRTRWLTIVCSETLPGFQWRQRLHTGGEQKPFPESVPGKSVTLGSSQSHLGQEVGGSPFRSLKTQVPDTGEQKVIISFSACCQGLSLFHDVLKDLSGPVGEDHPSRSSFRDPEHAVQLLPGPASIHEVHDVLTPRTLYIHLFLLKGAARPS